MLKAALFTGLMSLSFVVHADIEINKIVDAEIAKCQSKIDLRSIFAYGLVAEWGNFPLDKVKAKLSESQFNYFMEIAEKVKPYLQHLAKDGELVDAGADALTQECAAFGKSALMLGMLKLSPVTSRSQFSE